MHTRDVKYWTRKMTHRMTVYTVEEVTPAFGDSIFICTALASSSKARGVLCATSSKSSAPKWVNTASSNTRCEDGVRSAPCQSETLCVVLLDFGCKLGHRMKQPPPDRSLV